MLTSTLLLATNGVRAGLATDALNVTTPAPASVLRSSVPGVENLDQFDEASIIAILIGLLKGEIIHGNDFDGGAGAASHDPVGSSRQAFCQPGGGISFRLAISLKSAIISPPPKSTPCHARTFHPCSPPC